MIYRMAAARSTQRPRRTYGTRRANGPSLTLRARVSPGHKRLAELGARARGVTIARYLELLIEGDEVAHRAAQEESAGAEERQQQCA